MDGQSRDFFPDTLTHRVRNSSLYNITFHNGYLPYPIEKENADGSKVMTYNTIAGDGIGFKLGGSIMEGDVVLNNCLAFDNKLHGFGDNSNPGFIEITNCTAVNNCAGIDENGNISGRGLKDETNKSNNFDLARTIASYNSYSGLVSYISNQADYIPVGDSEYNTDMFRGCIEYSILNTSYEDGKEVYKAFVNLQMALGIIQIKKMLHIRLDINMMVCQLICSQIFHL